MLDVNKRTLTIYTSAAFGAPTVALGVVSLIALLEDQNWKSYIDKLLESEIGGDFTVWLLWLILEILVAAYPFLKWEESSENYAASTETERAKLIKDKSTSESFEREKQLEKENVQEQKRISKKTPIDGSFVNSESARNEKNEFLLKYNKINPQNRTVTKEAIAALARSRGYKKEEKLENETEQLFKNFVQIALELPKETKSNVLMQSCLPKQMETIFKTTEQKNNWEIAIKEILLNYPHNNEVLTDQKIMNMALDIYSHIYAEVVLAEKDLDKGTLLAKNISIALCIRWINDQDLDRDFKVQIIQKLNLNFMTELNKKTDKEIHDLYQVTSVPQSS